MKKLSKNAHSLADLHTSVCPVLGQRRRP